MTEPELAAFEEYFYHITADRGSGEFALRHLLGPFAWARNALESRLHELKVGLRNASQHAALVQCLSITELLHVVRFQMYEGLCVTLNTSAMLLDV